MGVRRIYGVDLDVAGRGYFGLLSVGWRDITVPFVPSIVPL